MSVKTRYHWSPRWQQTRAARSSAVDRPFVSPLGNSCQLATSANRPARLAEDERGGRGWSFK